MIATAQVTSPPTPHLSSKAPQKAEAAAATVEMAQLINPPLVSDPVSEDIPAEYVYGVDEPNPEALVDADLYALAGQWVDKWNQAVDQITNGGDTGCLDDLVARHAQLKDQLALTWDFHQYHNLDDIKSVLAEQLPKVKAHKFVIDRTADHRYPNGISVQTVHPASDGNPPIEWVQVVCDFETENGYAKCLLRLVLVKSGLKAYCIYTGLDQIKGNEEQLGRLRGEGVNHGQHEGRESWKDRRSRDFQWGGEKQPTVLIVGGGQGGLNTAARLKVMGVDSLIVEKNDTIGDNWRNRYKFLVLHDPVWYDHLAYLNFPPTWPVFTPKDKLGDWFESYADLMELSYWTKLLVSGAEFDDATGSWTVNINNLATGETTTLHPRHVVMATGHSGEPNVPQFKGQDQFKGEIHHSSQHTTGKAYTGENCLVVGACNSAHDIAQDFYEQGALPTLLQRSSTCIINSEVGLKITTAGLYEEGGPKTETADLIFQLIPIKLLNMVMQQQYRETCKLEKDLHDSLKDVGFKMDAGYGGTGLFGKYFRRGGGYYIDVGCSKLIADKKINWKQGVEIDHFTENGVVFTDGLQMDNLACVVLATGYSNMRDTARRIFGDKVADRLNPVWGLNDEGDLKVMWRQSGHPHFWYMGGNLAMSRFYSKMLALKIIGEEKGLC